MKAYCLFVLIFLFCPLPLLVAQETKEPKLVSLFPLGGRVGSCFETEIRGEHLGGTYAIWFDCETLQATIEMVEEIDLDEGKEAQPKQNSGHSGHRVLLKVTVKPNADIGPHLFRLVTPRGVSSPLALRVHAESAVLEHTTTKNTSNHAQPIDIPAVVHGKISRSGERDFYAFEAAESQRLRFEVLTSSGFLHGVLGSFNPPELVLYDRSGSWFDSRRAVRLEVEDESVFVKRGKMVFFPRMTFRFPKKGRYLAAVGSLDGMGGADFSYQLRIASTEGHPTPVQEMPVQKKWSSFALDDATDLNYWQEREFTRTISSDRLQQILSRSVRLPKTNEPEGAVAGRDHAGLLNEIPETEPNDKPSQALEVSLPVIVQGVIDHPADVDSFRFRVKTGQRLAFEIETPGIAPPHFSPLLKVINANGQEVLSNIYRKVGGDGDDWIKTIQPKITRTFDKGGEYCLLIRDLTSRRAHSQFVYRVLIRPQIPHVGQVRATLKSGVLNLIRGKSLKLTVAAEKEEGFAGEVAISLENFPQGVEVFPTTNSQDKQRSDRNVGPRAEMHKKRFFSERVSTTIVLVTSDDAPITSMPRLVRLTARPITHGFFAAPLTVQTILLMVVQQPEEK